MAATTETMAGIAPGANPVERLREAFNRLSEQQKILLMVAVAALVAVIVGSILWSRQPDWKVLFSNLNEKDGGAIVAVLEAQNIPHKYSDGGSLMLPAERVHEVRRRHGRAVGVPEAGRCHVLDRAGLAVGQLDLDLLSLAVFGFRLFYSGRFVSYRRGR